MAISNVRFYKLATLPTFEAKYNGIFVHVTSKLTRHLKEDKVTYEYHWGGLNDKDIQGIVIQKIVEKETPTPTTRSILVPEWMNSRRINIVESGLWFGGENGWELLSNDTTDAAINAAIDDKISTLVAGPYAQAEITTATDSSTLTISGIKENNGIIAKDDINKLDVAIDGVYDKTNNKIATVSTVTTAVTTAIEALDSEDTIQAVTFNTAVDTGNTTLTFTGIKEENGKILPGDGATNFIVGDAKLKIQIGSNEAGAFEVFSANAQSNGAIKLNEYVFQKGENNVISVITPTAVSERNRLVTEQDIANLSGAMHYKGSILNADAWPSTVKAGDVYIATGNFVKDGNTIESGDLIVFNSATLTDYKVVQSNITLGIGNGQIAANVGALTNGNLVVGVNDPESGKKGIKTVEFDVTNLTGETGKNERNLTIGNGTVDSSDTTLYHDVTITDDFTVIGKPFTKSIKISSTNRSIKIAKNGDTGVMVDLVWNTRLE